MRRISSKCSCEYQTVDRDTDQKPISISAESTGLKCDLTLHLISLNINTKLQSETESAKETEKEREINS